MSSLIASKVGTRTSADSFKNERGVHQEWTILFLFEDRVCDEVMTAPQKSGQAGLINQL